MRGPTSAVLALALSNAASAAVMKTSANPNVLSQLLALFDSLIQEVEDLESLLGSGAPTGVPTSLPGLPTGFPGLPTGLPSFPTSLPSLSVGIPPLPTIPSLSPGTPLLPTRSASLSVVIPSLPTAPSLSPGTPLLPTRSASLSVVIPIVPPIPTGLPTAQPSIPTGLPPIGLPTESIPDFSISIPIPTSFPTGLPSFALPPLPVGTEFPIPPRLPIPSSIIASDGLPPVPATTVNPPTMSILPVQHESEAEGEHVEQEQQLAERQLGAGAGAGFGAVINGFIDLANSLSSAASLVAGGANLGDANNQKQACSAYHNFAQEQLTLQKQLVTKAKSIDFVSKTALGAALAGLQATLKPFESGLVASVPQCAKAAQADQKAVDKAVGQSLCVFASGFFC